MGGHLTSTSCQRRISACRRLRTTGDRPSFCWRRWTPPFWWQAASLPPGYGSGAGSCRRSSASSSTTRASSPMRSSPSSGSPSPSTSTARRAGAPATTCWRGWPPSVSASPSPSLSAPISCCHGDSDAVSWPSPCSSRCPSRRWCASCGMRSALAPGRAEPW